MWVIETFLVIVNRLIDTGFIKMSFTGPTWWEELVSVGGGED
jgi:hypothetical protein